MFQSNIKKEEDIPDYNPGPSNENHINKFKSSLKSEPDDMKNYDATYTKYHDRSIYIELVDKINRYQSQKSVTDEQKREMKRNYVALVTRIRDPLMKQKFIMMIYLCDHLNTTMTQLVMDSVREDKSP